PLDTVCFSASLLLGPLVPCTLDGLTLEAEMAKDEDSSALESSSDLMAGLADMPRQAGGKQWQKRIFAKWGCRFLKWAVLVNGIRDLEVVYNNQRLRFEVVNRLVQYLISIIETGFTRYFGSFSKGTTTLEKTNTL